MDRSVSKLDAFIRELTDFSRNERLELNYDLIDFPGIVKECQENLYFMEKADQVKLITEYNCQSEILSDPMRLKVILNNLISNSVKYQDLSKENSFVKIIVNCSPKEAKIEVSE